MLIKPIPNSTFTVIWKNLHGTKIVRFNIEEENNKRVSTTAQSKAHQATYIVVASGVIPATVSCYI